MKEWLRLVDGGIQDEDANIVDEVHDFENLTIDIGKAKQFLVVDVNRGVLRCVSPCGNGMGVLFRRFQLSNTSGMRLSLFLESEDVEKGSGHLLRKALRQIDASSSRLASA